MNNDDELDIFFNQKASSQVKVVVQPKGRITESKVVPEIQKPPQKTVPMISMKAFLFNFKKFYKEKTRIRNLLSEASAKQRNISIKIYLRNHIATYKDIKTMLLQTRIQEVHALQRFEQLAFKNLADREDTRIYVRNELTDRLAEQCQNALQELFMQKESAFYEKRIITKFLFTMLSTEAYQPLGYPDLANKFRDFQSVNSLHISIIGNFIKSFSKVLKSQTFKLVDIAQFLYEYKYRRSDVDIIMLFVVKVKNLYNSSQSQPKGTPIDGDRPLSIKLITTQFDIIVNKDKTNVDLIQEVLNTLRFLINDQIRVDTVERVQKIMEYNIIGDYLQKYFKDLDAQIQDLLTYIDQITNLIYSIDKLNLSTKQDQLEVLLGFIHKIQDHEIEAETARISQKHSIILQELLHQLNETLEDAQVNQKRKKTELLDMQGGIMPIKKVLYEDDFKVGDQPNANPYKQQTTDLPIRRPKIINLEVIQPQVPQKLEELKQAEDYINTIIENEYDKESLMLSQIYQKQDKNAKITQEYTNLRGNEVERDLLYEHQFQRLQQSTGAKSKEEMVMELQKQIKDLRQQVEQHKPKK